MKKTVALQFMLLCVLGVSIFSSGCDRGEVVPPEDATISTHITADRILTDRVSGDAADYIVKGEIEVKNGATLTVKPGVIIQFEQDAGLIITDMSSLNALGTAAKPIKFTGKQATKGFWKGLVFVDSDNINNELTHCTVEYGGGDWYLYEEGNIVLGSNDYGRGRLKLDNVTLSNSSTMGMYISSDAYLDVFTNCVLANNNKSPLRVEANNSGVINTNNDFSNNTENYILIDGDPYGGRVLKNDITWRKCNVPYGIKETIKTEKTLTIEAGVEILGLDDAGFEIDGEGSKSGNLVVNGTASNHVTMRGLQATKGFWNGIYLWGGQATLSYCDISYAGDVKTFDTAGRAAIVAESYYDQVSSLTLNNCSIAHSLYYAVAVDSSPDPGSGGAFSSFSDNGTTYTDNTSGNLLTY